MRPSKKFGKILIHNVNFFKQEEACFILSKNWLSKQIWTQEMSQNYDYTEFELIGREREEVLLLMERNLKLKASVQLGLNENKSRSGLTGGDAN